MDAEEHGRPQGERAEEGTEGRRRRHDVVAAKWFAEASPSGRQNTHLYIQNSREEIYTSCRFSKESCGKLSTPGFRSRIFHFLAAQGWGNGAEAEARDGGWVGVRTHLK